MEAKEFDLTANTRMSSEQSQVASTEAAVGEPPTAFAPATAPEKIYPRQWQTQFQEKLHEQFPPTAFAPATAPGERMDSKKAADVAPRITQLQERFKALDTANAEIWAKGQAERDARWAAQLKQLQVELDAKGAARREQPVQLERKNVEQQAVQWTRDHKMKRQFETVADGIDLR